MTIQFHIATNNKQHTKTRQFHSAKTHTNTHAYGNQINTKQITYKMYARTPTPQTSDAVEIGFTPTASGEANPGVPWLRKVSSDGEIFRANPKSINLVLSIVGPAKSRLEGYYQYHITITKNDYKYINIESIY